MLFEKNTFLNICYQDRHHDSVQDENELNERLEELRNVFLEFYLKTLRISFSIIWWKNAKSHHMKTYKMICSRNTTDYTNFEIKCSRNTIVISEFTEYTFIMVVSHNPQISKCFWVIEPLQRGRTNWRSLKN